MTKKVTPNLGQKENNRLKQLEKKYDKLLGNKSLVGLSEEKLKNSEKPINESNYQKKAVSFVKPLYNLYLDACDAN